MQLIDPTMASFAWALDVTGQRLNAFSHPTFHAEPKNVPFLKILFLHPSVMMRRRFLEGAGRYDPDRPRAEHNELWLRGTSAGCCDANLPESLLEHGISGYVRSWRSMTIGTLALLRITSAAKVRKSRVLSLVHFGYSAAIRRKIYRSKPLRAVRQPYLT